MHLAYKIRHAHDLHQSDALPRFLGPVVMFEDANELSRKVPTEANPSTDRTVVNSKLFLFQLNGLAPQEGPGDKIGLLRAQGKYEKGKNPHVVQESCQIGQVRVQAAETEGAAGTQSSC